MATDSGDSTNDSPRAADTSPPAPPAPPGGSEPPLESPAAWAARVKWVVGTVAIGAVGSGVWELFFRPGFGAIARATLRLVALLPRAYRDRLCEDAATLPHAATALHVYLFIATVCLMVPIFASLILTWRLLRPAGVPRSPPSLRRSVVSVWALTSVAVASSLLSFQLANVPVRMFRVVETNMAMLGAVATDQEVRHWRAKFAGVRTRVDFDMFRRDFIAFARERGVLVYQLEDL